MYIHIFNQGTCEVMKKLKGVKARAKPLRKLTKWDDGANLSRFILGDIGMLKQCVSSCSHTHTHTHTL